MKPVLLSQRVECLAARGERRDALDQRLVHWLAEMGVLAVPVPNNPALVAHYWAHVKPVAVVLSGGNDLACLGGDAPERDATELALVNQALAEGLPLLGLCRGMQFLIRYFGGELQAIEGHVGTRHQLQIGNAWHDVNSYHGWGAYALPDPLCALAYAEDGCVEAMRHSSLPVLGLMWHPERETPYNPQDVARVKDFLMQRRYME